MLTAIVLGPVVRFGYFLRRTFMAFRNFGDTDERIEKAVATRRRCGGPDEHSDPPRRARRMFRD